MSKMAQTMNLSRRDVIKHAGGAGLGMLAGAAATSAHQTSGTDLIRGTIEMPYHFNLALDNGVTPGELSEAITHLAFYAGWPYAFSAGPVFRQVFESRRN